MRRIEALITGAVLIAVIVAGIINASTSTTTITTTATATTVNSTNGNTIVKILLIIINTIASGFHWLAHFLTFKPITSGQPGSFYVPIVEWGWNYNFGTRVIVLPNAHGVAYNGTTTVTATIVNGTTTTVTTVTLTGNNTIYWTVIVHGAPVEWTLHDSYNYYVNGNGNTTGVFYISGVTDTLTLTAPSTCTINPSSTVTVIAGTGSNITFTINCPTTSTTTGSATTTTGTSTGTITSPPPTTTTVNQGWELLVSVNDQWANVEYSISDNFGNGLIGSGPLRYYPFHTYPYSVTQVALTASIINEPSGWNCAIAPSTTVVSQPSNPLEPASVTFTVSCVTPTPTTTPTSTPTPTPTSTPTSTPPPTTTPTSTPPPTSIPPPTSTTPTPTSSPPPTTVTSTNTVTTPLPTITNGVVVQCVGGSVPLGQAYAFECWAEWASATVTTLTAQATTPGPFVVESISLTGTSAAGQYAQTWGVTGTCPPHFEPTVTYYGGNINWNGYSTQSTTTWYVTVEAWCVNPRYAFAFFSTWNPPEIPINWLLRGGTNTLAPLEPLYLETWNEYVSTWLAVNGFMLDLLILLALVLPILARPGLRRLRVT